MNKNANDFLGGGAQPEINVTASKITSNITMAMKLQSEENQEVAGFLSTIGLQKYIEKFIDNGVEDLETILELQDQHISQMGIPLGHKLKIIKRIKEVRQERGLSVPASSQSTRTKVSDIQYNEGSSIRPVTNNVYEELPDPTAESQST